MRATALYSGIVSYTGISINSVDVRGNAASLAVQGRKYHRQRIQSLTFIARRRRDGYLPHRREMSIQFFYLLLRKPAGGACCPQFSLRTLNHRGRVREGSFEVSRRESQHRVNDGRNRFCIPLWPGRVCEPKIRSDSTVKSLVAACLFTSAVFDHETGFLKNAQVIVQTVGWLTQRGC